MEQEGTEILKALQEAKDGYWLPFTVLAGAFTMIISLLLVIWRNMIKSNNTRHTNTEATLKTTVENQTSLRLLVTEYGVDIKNNRRDIENNREDIKAL